MTYSIPDAGKYPWRKRQNWGTHCTTSEKRFQARFKTKTRDTDKHTQIYLQGLLTVKGKRNYANIIHKINGPKISIYNFLK